MAEYIEREAAKEAVKYIPWCDWKAVSDCLDELPAADVVPVVRCKDCKYGELFLNSSGAEYVDCKLDDYALRTPKDFCSYGERRADK